MTHTIFSWGLLALSACLLALPVHASSTNGELAVGTLLEKAAAAGRHIHSVGGKFVQTRHVSMMATPLVSHGRMFFSLSPERGKEKILWEYTRPQLSGFLYNEGKALCWIDSFHERRPLKHREAAFVRGLTEQIHMWTAIDPDRLGRLYVLQARDDHSLSLTPRRPSLYTAIEATFSDDFRQLRALRLYDAEGFTHLEFRDVELNGPLPLELR